MNCSKFDVRAVRTPDRGASFKVQLVVSVRCQVSDLDFAFVASRRVDERVVEVDFVLCDDTVWFGGRGNFHHHPSRPSERELGRVY